MTLPRGLVQVMLCSEEGKPLVVFTGHPDDVMNCVWQYEHLDDVMDDDPDGLFAFLEDDMGHEQ